MKFDYPEGATPIDPNAAMDLLQPQITTQAQLNEAEQANILEAQLWTRTRKHKMVLDERFIKTVHKRMFGDVWKWAGAFKRTDHQNERFARREEVATRLRQLLENTKYRLEQTPPVNERDWDLFGAEFHHRLVLVHAFANGNGRHAREITDLLLLQQGQKPFSWGSRSLIAPSDTRRRYIDALRAADDGDYSKLVEFVRS
ncbi:MAG: mobile mystery protein B [Candidatus Kapaibacterium sp.]